MIINKKPIFEKMLGTRFRFQLVLAFVSLTVTVIILISVLFNSIAQASFIKMNRYETNNIVKQLSYNVDSTLEFYERTMNRLCQNSIVYNQLKRIKSNTDYLYNIEIYQFLKDYLNNYIYTDENNIDIAGAKLYENGNRIIKDNIFIFGFQQNEQHITNKLRLSPHNYYWGTTRKDERGQLTLTLTSKLPQYYMEEDILIELSFYESELRNLYKEFENNHDIFILNAEGSIVSSTDRSLLGKDIKDLSGYSFDVLSHNSTSKALSYNGKNYDITSHNTKKNWKIVVSTDYSILFKDYYELSKSVFFVSIFVAFLAIGFSILFSNYFNNRMGLLLRKIKLLRGRDFKAYEPIKGKDEFALLGVEIDNTREEINQMLTEIQQTNKQKRVAEISALRSQINIHFLINTLSSIRWLAVENKDTSTSSSIEFLSTFLRLSLSRDGDYITLTQELEHLSAYVNLQKLRYEHRINVNIELNCKTIEIKTIKLILQPLLENCIFHGMRNTEEALSICVKIYEEKNNLIFKVIDNGVGIPADRINEILEGRAVKEHSGYGLFSVNQRLKLHFGDEYGILISSKIGQGTEITVSQPI